MPVSKRSKQAVSAKPEEAYSSRSSRLRRQAHMRRCVPTKPVSSHSLQRNCGLSLSGAMPLSASRRSASALSAAIRSAVSARSASGSSASRSFRPSAKAVLFFSSSIAARRGSAAYAAFRRASASRSACVRAALYSFSMLCVMRMPFLPPRFRRVSS